MRNELARMKSNLYAMRKGKHNVNISKLDRRIKQIKFETGRSEQFILATAINEGLLYGPTFRLYAERFKEEDRAEAEEPAAVAGADVM